jgi:hypothetical protein
MGGVQWILGSLTPRVKRPGREAAHSPPFSVEVKECVELSSTPQYVFMAWCLVKHRGNFIITLPKHHFLNVYRGVG